jgi:hypothetical protein
MADTIYVEGRYLEGKLLCKRYIIRGQGVDPFGDVIEECASLRAFAYKIRDSCFDYQNLETEEIQASKGGVMLRRPLTLRELEWIALNSTKQKKSE